MLFGLERKLPTESIFCDVLSYSVMSSRRGLILNLATADMISGRTFGASAYLWYVLHFYASISHSVTRGITFVSYASVCLLLI